MTLQGYELWKQKWLPNLNESIVVSHPDYPAQRHKMIVYRLECAPTVVFAAGEFSNGVWGFYEPSPAQDHDV